MTAPKLEQVCYRRAEIKNDSRYSLLAGRAQLFEGDEYLGATAIDFVAPALTTGNEFVSVLSAGAHSPNAARCFFNFLFTEKGQIAYNGPTSVSPFGAIGGGEPLPSAYIDPKINEVAQHQKELLTLMGLQ